MTAAVWAAFGTGLYLGFLGATLSFAVIVDRRDRAARRLQLPPTATARRRER